MLFLSCLLSLKCNCFGPDFYQTQMEYLDLPFRTTILRLSQLLSVVTSTLWSKAYFVYWLTVSPFVL